MTCNSSCTGERSSSVHVFGQGVMTIDMNAYKDLVRAVELEELFIVDFRSTRRVDIDFPLRFATEFSIGEPVLSERAIAVEATLDFSADARHVPNNTADNPSVQIKISWQVVYSFADKDPRDIDEKLVQEFVQRNVPLNVWPYARAVVTTATAQMGLPPLVLETFKVFG